MRELHIYVSLYVVIIDTKYKCVNLSFFEKLFRLISKYIHCQKDRKAWSEGLELLDDHNALLHHREDPYKTLYENELTYFKNYLIDKSKTKKETDFYWYVRWEEVVKQISIKKLKSLFQKYPINLDSSTNEGVDAIVKENAVTSPIASCSNVSKRKAASSLSENTESEKKQKTSEKNSQDDLIDDMSMTELLQNVGEDF